MDEGNGFGFGVVGGNAKDDDTLEVLLTVVGLVAVDDPAAPLAPPEDDPKTLVLPKPERSRSLVKEQVWSHTQLHSTSFLQSRSSVKKCSFFSNNKSTVFDTALGPLQLADLCLYL